ncbi:2-succinyl-5-enolpyruvyl-6-hydroxy-3-cyclohexene-1-carboxylate synthase [Verrucomicrobia bacterium IMCC26134]|nr:2-succinyl-5-enolpyruvyl-6-hydroxy-3-cyclohexene-1-carboxylate synthase [Verrucomicrobia bacterium IMCC26134]
MNLDFRNTNSLWCSVAAETLYRAGVRHAVISPGSRNTPLTMALVCNQGIGTTAVLDERSAGFFALGIAKRTGRPVVLLCTSGSAGAHYLPSIIEAKESGTPLIVITADRPPELRDCASGQTIDQQKLYGSFVTFYHELAVPEPRVELLKYLRQTLRHACERAEDGGPVHLNAPFRDPLPPLADGTAEPLAGAVDWDNFFALPELPAVVERSALELCFVEGAERGIIIAGGAAGSGTAENLAKELGWPILADGLAPERLKGSPNAFIVAAYDAVLRDSRCASALKPSHVVLVGEMPASKVLRAWLAALDIPMIHLSSRPDNRDALHGRTRVIRSPLHSQASQRVDAGWKKCWARAESAAQAVLGKVVNQRSFEGAFTRTVAETMTGGQTLFVASSMPVRDLEYFAPVRSDGPRVIANRGANGIDGMLSTALGVAHEGEPTVLLTGDLALLHDTNGFLSASKLSGSLTVVVINNQGGGIFGHLPVAKNNPHFEEYWATPQHVDIGRLCAAYAVPHFIAAIPAELKAMLGVHMDAQGLRVIEVRTDRTNDVTTRQLLLAEAACAAGDAVA